MKTYVDVRYDEQAVNRVLVGRAVAVSVGEPWDFESEDGQNVLLGAIESVDLARGERAAQEVVLSVTPFRAKEGITVRRLRATARYEDGEGIVEHLLRGEDAEVNLHYGDHVPRENLIPGATPKLIGGFALTGR